MNFDELPDNVKRRLRGNRKYIEKKNQSLVRDTVTVEEFNSPMIDPKKVKYIELNGPLGGKRDGLKEFEKTLKGNKDTRFRRLITGEKV